MEQSPLISRLIEDLRCLPGVGPKSAQRMAFHLLQHNREAAKLLSKTLLEAVTQVGHCQSCRNLCEQPTCGICSSSKRDRTLLCVVESPADVFAVEQATGYRGLYFVLMGHLSPIDGIGPAQIGLDLLESRFANDTLKEIILATNPTVEGEATAHYISEMLRDKPIKITRLAHGVPIGGEIEYIDSNTLSHAFAGRKEL